MRIGGATSSGTGGVGRGFAASGTVFQPSSIRSDASQSSLSELCRPERTVLANPSLGLIPAGQSAQLLLSDGLTRSRMNPDQSKQPAKPKTPRATTSTKNRANSPEPYRSHSTEISIEDL